MSRSENSFNHRHLYERRRARDRGERWTPAIRISWRGDNAQPPSAPDVEALDVKLNGLLVGVRRGNASITSCSLVMRMSQASHISPSAGPPQNLGTLLYGRRLSMSLL